VARIEQDAKIGMVTSKIRKLHQDNKPTELDSTGDFYHIWGRPHPRGRDEVDRGQYDTAEEVFGASGGATLYRYHMLERIGLFDEEFFAYYEDIDISFRARLAGYTTWYEPKAVVNHKIGGTSGGGASALSRYHSVKNQWYVYLKDMPASLFWKYLPRFLFLQILFYGNSFLTGLVWPHTKSILRGLMMTPAMLVKRMRIQHGRKLTAAQVDRLLLRAVPPGVGPNFRRYFGWLIKNGRR
jgi:GT2 family glycosyltransferase